MATAEDAVLTARGQLDFYVSHSGHDRGWAEWVARHLIEADYTVELNSWDRAGGENFVTMMRNALQNARWVIALVSPEYLELSRDRSDEWSAALTKDADGRHRLLLVRIEPCEMPRILQPLLWCDLVGTTEDEAFRRLVAAARGLAGPQGRPTFSPSGAARHLAEDTLARQRRTLGDDHPVNVQVLGFAAAVRDGRLRFGGGRGVAVVAERGFGDDPGL